LFSSDQETARNLARALQELEFELQHCPEIFGAVEKLTSQSFELIICDWDEGPEATFLLKTSRELKNNRGAFAIAIAGAATSPAALTYSGAHLVLRKPIENTRFKSALFTCDEFLQHMKSWLPKLGFVPPGQQAPHSAHDKPWPARERKMSRNASRDHSDQPSPKPDDASATILPVTPAFWSVEDTLFRGTGTADLFRQSKNHPGLRSRDHQRRVLPWMAIVVALLAGAYALSQPIHG
jgi:hypothetical protein